MSSFARFGPSHLAVLALVGTSAAAMAALLRVSSPRTARRLRLALAALMLAGSAAEIATGFAFGLESPADLLPLQLCDLSLMLGAFTLTTLSVRAVEPLYFFTLLGTVPALLAPELPDCGPREARFLAYFGLHGLTVVALLALTAGARLRPRPGGWWRALLWLNAYATAIALVNAAFGTNYLYLRARPAVPTPLDWLGTGAWYLPSLELAVIAVFLVLERLAAVTRPAPAGRSEHGASADMISGCAIEPSDV